MVSSKTPVLRRYTNLAATIHMLREKKITLLNPASWDDKNDSHFMAEYKRLASLKTVLALCFTKTTERYHHWRVFSHGSDGVYITFHRNRLLGAFAGSSQILKGDVIYKKIDDVVAAPPRIGELPFRKRLPYKDEKEFRVVFKSKIEICQFKDFELDLSSISRITLSPWMSESLYNSVKTTLRSIDGCEKVRISRSSLVNNEKWKTAASRAR